MRKFDLKISNATVIDGSGVDRYAANVYVSADRIAAIEPRIENDTFGDYTASATLDASGKVLAPGFIDAHTHDDLLLIKSPEMLPKASQGVTTVVTGNCGISLAPMKTCKLVPPFDLIGDECDFSYPSIDGYASQLDDQPACLNSVMLTGHASLRLEAMDNLQRVATASEIKVMRNNLEKALQQGAIGMSTGLAYPTAFHATTREVTEIAAVLNDYGAIYTSHIRNEEDQLLESVEETLQIGRDADVPVVISHHKACGRKNWGKTRQSIAMIDAARKQQRVDLDVYPYTASSTVLLYDFVARAERVTITWSKAVPESSGRDLADLCHEWNIDVKAAISRLNPAGAIYHQMDENDLQRVLQYGPSMIGSDGLPKDERPHPRLWGTFPRVLGYYCRDLQLFTLEQAIEKMTARPAQVFGIKQRGQIKTGYYADLVLFDADTISDRATYDSPTEPSAGIDLVIVNGSVIYQDGKSTQSYPGRFLRH